MKIKVQKIKVNIAITFFILLLIFCFISFSNPFSNLTTNQKILLAQAYYRVAIYYYDHNNKEKGDAFKSVAHYLDPNFVKKEVSFETRLLTDEEIENRINQARENTPSFIKDFFKTKNKTDLSYPVYNLATADLFTDETIDVILSVTEINQFFSSDFEISKVEYEKASNLSSFLPLVYLEDDLLYVVHNQNSENMVVLLVRNFGIKLKIIGFLPVQKKTLIK